MAMTRPLVFLLILSLLWTFTRGDVELSCDFMKSCMLLCSFVPGEEVVIHWIQLKENLNVHSYYHGQDQLAYQNPRFKGRTSLFQDQVSAGNASLLLYDVQIQDETKYKCYISTISGSKDSYINLKVAAPVNQIHIQQVGNRLSCSSEGIYPEPVLTWSINPPSNTAFKNTATVEKTEQLLYNISGSLILSDNNTDVDVSCTISTSSNWRRATWGKLTSISGSNDQTIQCAAPTNALTSITWKFNHSEIIVDHNMTVSDKWRPHVKVGTDSGSLIVQLLSSDRDGIYTCELNDGERTLVTNTFLEYKQDSSSVSAVAWGVAVGVVGLILIICIAICCKRKQQKPQTQTGNSSNEAADDNRTYELLLKGNGTTQTPT